MPVRIVQTYKNCFKERQFQLVEKPYICFASGGFVPWTPNGALPVPRWGPWWPQDPHLAWGPSAPSATYFLSFSYFKSFWQPCKYLSTRCPGAFLFPIYKELRIIVVLWYSQRTRNHHGPSLASYTEFCLYYNMFLTTEISCKR